MDFLRSFGLSLVLCGFIHGVKCQSTVNTTEADTTPLPTINATPEVSTTEKETYLHTTETEIDTTPYTSKIETTDRSDTTLYTTEPQTTTIKTTQYTSEIETTDTSDTTLYTTEPKTTEMETTQYTSEIETTDESDTTLYNTEPQTTTIKTTPYTSEIETTDTSDTTLYTTESKTTEMETTQYTSEIETTDKSDTTLYTTEPQTTEMETTQYTSEIETTDRSDTTLYTTRTDTTVIQTTYSTSTIPPSRSSSTVLTPTTAPGICDYNLCQNGTCQEDPTADKGYICLCEDWFYGEYCEQKLETSGLMITNCGSDTVVGDTFSCSCEFSISQQMPLVITWITDSGVRISPGGTGRFQVSACGEANTDCLSVLTVDPVLLRDRGVLSCEGSVTGVPGRRLNHTDLTVVYLPDAAIGPKNAAIIVGEEIELECRGLDENSDIGSDIVLEWYVNEEIVSGTNKNPSTLKIDAKETGIMVVSCRAKRGSVMGTFDNSTIRVYEPPGGPGDKPTVWFCDPDVHVDSSEWPRAESGTYVTQPCRKATQKGFLQRFCSTDCSLDHNTCKWLNPDSTNCATQAYQDIANEIDDIVDGGSQTPDLMEDILHNLNNLTASEDAMEPGDLNVTLSVLDQLSHIQQATGARVSFGEIREALDVGSSTLEPSNNAAWDQISEVDANRVASLLVSLDVYCKVRAHAIFLGQSESFITPNIVTDIINVDLDEAGESISFPLTRDSEWLEDTDNITIDINAIGDINRYIFIHASFYKNSTIDAFMPTHTNAIKADDYTSFLRSKIASFTVATDAQKSKVNTFDPPIQLKFADVANLTSHPVADFEPGCSFWDVADNTWSEAGCTVAYIGDGFVTCECDHTTSFSVIMRPKISFSSTHDKILHWLSVVLLILSIGSLFITITVYGAMWQTVKSKTRQEVIILDLSAALLVTYTLFLIGFDRNVGVITITNDTLCTAFSVLLHYFLLVVFGVMFVEAVHIFLINYTTLRLRVNNYLDSNVFVALVILAWVVPLVIVGITMGVTQFQGYISEKYCWIESYNVIIWGFLILILIVLAVNTCILVYVLVVATESRKNSYNDHKSHLKCNLMNMVVLLPLFGLSWIFGLFQHVVFHYFFVLLNCSQGILILILHVFLNPKLKEHILYSEPSTSGPSSSRRTQSTRETASSSRNHSDVSDSYQHSLDDSEVSNHDVVLDEYSGNANELVNPAANTTFFCPSLEPEPEPDYDE